jgi:16S rRNA (cytidine1402-2'-O)-methyltransferase
MSSRHPLPPGPPESASEASSAPGDPQPRARAGWRDLTKGPLPLAPGLYLAATPIGNLRDVTLRVLDALAEADRILAEDTRQSRRLLDAYGIEAPLQAYHEHNAEQARPAVLAALEAGERILLITDAGTPLVSDPGYKLARAAIEGGHAVHALPGASAAIAGLSVSGLPSDRFLFAGFPPSKAGARRRWYASLAGIEATLILFEAPHRLAASLADAADALGEDRPGAIARELTKRHEETRRGPLGVLAAHYHDAGAPKGEIVLLIGPAPEGAASAPEQLDAALRDALTRLSPSQAAAEVARLHGLSKKALYARALALKDGRE